MKVAICLLAVLTIAQAGTIDLRSKAFLEPFFNSLQETRQLDIGPTDIVNIIYTLLKIANFTPSISQAYSILVFATRLVGIIQRIREGTLAVQTAITNITNELAKIFNCQDNPKQMEGVANGLMQALGLVKGGVGSVLASVGQSIAAATAVASTNKVTEATTSVISSTTTTTTSSSTARS